MQFGIIQGSVVATQKVKDLEGIVLRVLVPCDSFKKPMGSAIVAVDPIGTRVGDCVMWVGKREASLAIPGALLSNSYPVDAAITGIVDDIS